jgi:hypothetical protein
MIFLVSLIAICSAVPLNTTQQAALMMLYDALNCLDFPKCPRFNTTVDCPPGASGSLLCVDSDVVEINIVAASPQLNGSVPVALLSQFPALSHLRLSGNALALCQLCAAWRRWNWVAIA